MWPAIIISGILVILIIIVISVYNKLVKLRLRVENQWSQVDVRLKERFDLIPNLVETVKGYASHEKETLENVINARNRAVTATTPEEAMDSEKSFQGALSRLFALAESYPDLKANTNFMDLQRKLSDMESQIAKYRQFYNDSVMRYNQTKAVFPNNIIANMFGFEDKKFFTVETAEKEVPKVSF
ncbi:MAG TPA: LemA family protein [Clostridia bacterium]|nr:LemA family protein [Clostridiaceae bacterium]HPZ53360.1 LemA family protein [Clostridia bacterium]